MLVSGQFNQVSINVIFDHLLLKKLRSSLQIGFSMKLKFYQALVFWVFMVFLGATKDIFGSYELQVMIVLVFAQTVESFTVVTF